MAKPGLRHTLSSSFSVLRYQLILLIVALCVRALFWVLQVQAHTALTVVYTFVAGNLSLALIIICRPVFENRPLPWKLSIYLLLLLIIGVFANVVAEFVIFGLFAHPTVSFRHNVFADAPVGMLITLIVGMVHFIFDESRLKLEARNTQLQNQVQLGLVEKQIYQADLQQARDIQIHLLPRETPQIPGFRIACAWQPARSVSGDYFDVLILGEDRLGLCIADVSGKGMAAALLMANLQASVKAFTQNGSNPLNESPAELCARLNTALSSNIAPGRFVTFFYGILDSKSANFKYENAGHCLPLLVHVDGSIDFPAAYSGVLGLFSHWTYADREVELRSGDVLVLMTDGVLEAANGNEEEFGYQRLIASVVACRNQGAHAIRQRILADVTAFCSN